MPYSADVYKVMIASPGDVPEERRTVREVIAEWNAIHSQDRGQVLLPIGWETHSSPELGEHPQAIINRQVLEGCDLLVAVFWTRLGTRTEKAASGTVEEIESHVAAGKLAMLYFSATPVKLDSVDPKQHAALVKFRESCKPRGLYETFESPTEFRAKFTRQLAQKMIEKYPPASPSDVSPPNRPRRAALGTDALELLRAMGQNATAAYLLRIKSDAGVGVWAGGRTFTELGDPRSSARWEAAVRELEEHSLIDDPDHTRQKFDLTQAGFDEFDRRFGNIADQ